jgi:hypothetical protein
MGEMTREELAAMTGQELLAYDREHHGDPHMTLVKANGMQRVALQLWHLGAARKKADSEARAEARRRLHQKLFPSDSAVLESSDESSGFQMRTCTWAPRPPPRTAKS